MLEHAGKLGSLPTGLLPCFHCGFDLRGSAIEGRCPECGQTYRRELLYRDVVLQKVKRICDDANFVFGAALGIGHLTLCLIIAHMFSGRAGDTSLGMLVIPGALILGASYLMVLALYSACWFKLFHQLLWTRTLYWGQICGVGLSRALLRAGVGLTAPLVIVAFLML